LLGMTKAFRFRDRNLESWRSGNCAGNLRWWG
jgi:hypothetical protein